MENKNIKPLDKNYLQLIKEIKHRVTMAQYVALKAVNKELIDLYWDIGRVIVIKQKKFGWGKAVIETLAKDLQSEFVGMRGFSTSNLWRMKLFYETYFNQAKLAPLVREIGWAHNILIMEQCKDLLERQFYITMTKKYGWTKNVLIHQIENKSYEKYLLNQTNFEKTLPEKYKHQAKLAVKDEYTFDFLELVNEHSEEQLETSIVRNIRKFLVEMGGYFSFIANQYRIEIEGDEFFIDLLLHHRKLNCLVAIELKIGDFKPEYAGKMQFYLNALDEKVKMSHEKQSIGIIICKYKKRTIVEYSLKTANNPMGVATYKASSTLPTEFKKLLPAPKDIARAIDVLGDINAKS
jgi:predicted nuclease of restriction endonuclease-like (RecB) superfamily